MERFSSADSAPERYIVVDLVGFIVMAECGDSQGRANKVAQALNALDGGPL
jgi:hypothetical protein